MPTYMSYEWPEEKIRFETKPVGMRRFRIPHLFECPYFSGTMFELELVVHNDSGEIKNIGYDGELSRLPGCTEEGPEHVEWARGNLVIKPKSTNNQRMHLKNIPQPGNYSFEVSLTNNEKNYSDGMGGVVHKPLSRGDTVYFDALPRDYTAFNIVSIIIASVISLIIGLVLG